MPASRLSSATCPLAQARAREGWTARELVPHGRLAPIVDPLAARLHHALVDSAVVEEVSGLAKERAADVDLERLQVGQRAVCRICVLGAEDALVAFCTNRARVQAVSGPAAA